MVAWCELEVGKAQEHAAMNSAVGQAHDDIMLELMPDHQGLR